MSQRSPGDQGQAPTPPLFDDDEDFAAFAKAMQTATPRPDPGVKATHLRAAQAQFEKSVAARQEPADETRPNSTSLPAVGWLEKGLNAMIRTLSPLKSGLVATTALVAVGIVAFVPGTRSLFTPPQQEVSLPQPAGSPAPSELLAPSEPPVSARAPGREAAGGAAPVAGTLPAAPEADSITASDAAPPPEPISPSIAAEPMAEIAGAADASREKRLEAQPRRAAAPSVAPANGYLPAPAPMPIERLAPAPADTEAFANEDANPVKIVADEPVSTFSIDVDTASWGVVRSSLSRGALPPTDAVRVEEMINYFPYGYAAPETGTPFAPTVTVMETPWNADTKLVQIGLQGEMPAIEARPPLNLVFLIDTSGSMEDPSKLPLLVQSFRMMLTELRPTDQVAIVAYAGSAGVVLEPTAASETATISAALERLSAGGSTAGQEGLELAYSLAEKMTSEGDVSRILLATDGDFNVGVSDPDGLEAYVEKRRISGIYLSVLGFGRGNLDDAVMQSLAQNGNGTAAYIDTLSEARKVLVDELTGALFPIADDVKIQVEFNPAAVAEYRLIGYETRSLRREDFSNDKVDAGEIGAGVQVTAIYEVTPVGSPAILNDSLRYGASAEAAPEAADELGFLRLRYKAPGAETSQLMETPIMADASSGGTDQAFAAAIAGFGQLLRGGVYLGDWTYADAVALASASRGEDPYGYRAEAVQLMRLAETLAK